MRQEGQLAILFLVVLVCLVLDEVLNPTVAEDEQFLVFSCLYLPSAGITDVHQHIHVYMMLD